MNGNENHCHELSTYCVTESLHSHHCSRCFPKSATTMSHVPQCHLAPLPPRRGVPVPTFNVDSLVTTSTNRKCHKWHHFISGAVIKSPDNTHSAGSQTMQVALLFWDHQAGRPHVDTQVVRLSRAPEQQSMPTDQPGKWATLEILLRLYSGHRGYCHRCRN